MDWTEVRYQHVTALRSVLHRYQGAKPATINHVLAAVRGTLKRSLAPRADLTAEDLGSARATSPNVKATMLPAGRHVDVGEVAALFRACGDAPVGARDAAMLALLYGCGLRRSEAVALLLDDYDQGAVSIHHGKGRKERIVYCPAGGREAIDVMDHAPRCVARARCSARSKRAASIQERAMTRARQSCCASSSYPLVPTCRPFSPHDLRRSFVGELLDSQAPTSPVSNSLAGHASVTTTQRYDRRPEEAKRRTAELLHVPYAAPTLLAGSNPADSAGAGCFPTRRTSGSGTRISRLLDSWVLASRAPEWKK